MAGGDGRYEKTLSTTQSLPTWKEEIQTKLDEHRSRRTQSPEFHNRRGGADPSFADSSRDPATSRIAARVAERYAKAPTYREMLEREAAKAAQLAAEASAPEPAQAAEPMRSPELEQPRTVAHSASEPNLFPEPEQFQNQPAPMASAAAPADFVPAESAQNPVRLARWNEFNAPPAPEPESQAEPGHPSTSVALADDNQQEPSPASEESFQLTAESLHEEFAVSPDIEPSAESHTELFAESSESLLLNDFASAPFEPAQPLPARIIEFPRELIAPRKARRRRERDLFSASEEERAQLRIFEADPEPAAMAPVAPETAPESLPDTGAPQAEPRAASESEHVFPQWSPLRLDEEPQASAVEFGNPALPISPDSLLLDPPIYSASFGDRLMAGAVDFCLVGIGFLILVASFAASQAHLPTGKFAILAAAVAFLALYSAYQCLFLGISEATLGMRYARIALCTFDDENTTPRTRCARAGALLISALPLGLGLIWSLFDEDRLGWHDRITRTYQRSYRDDSI